MDKRFRFLSRLSLSLGIGGVLFGAVTVALSPLFTEWVSYAVYLLWIGVSVSAVVVSSRFRALYGRARSRFVFFGILLGCAVLAVQVALLTTLLFDAQEWTNGESTALLMGLLPCAAVALCVRAYVSARRRGIARSEWIHDLMHGVCADGYPDCVAVLSSRKTEWREEAVGLYVSDGEISLRRTVRYAASGEVACEKKVVLEGRYFRRHTLSAFCKRLNREFEGHTFYKKALAEVYFRMR